MIGPGPKRVPANSVDADQLVDGWNDEKASFNTGKITGANTPTFAALVGGIFEYNFSAGSLEELHLSPIHIGHDYKPGSDIFLHIHWSPNDTDTGVVRWGIEYAIAKGHGQQIFPSPTTIYLEQTGSGTAKQHQIIEDVAGISANIEPDSLILLRVFRDGAHLNDNYTGIAWGLELDAHYQTDRLATVNKEPNFYGP